MERKQITEEQVIRLLRNIGCSQALRGFDTTVDAIMEIIKCNGQRLLTKIYQRVADKEDMYPGSVERNIRYLVSNLYDNQDPDAIEKRLGRISNMKSGKPTNGEFLGAIIRTLDLESRPGDYK